MSESKFTLQKISVLKVLNGTSLAIAIALLPGAVFGELLAFIGTPFALELLNIANFATRMLPLVIGLCIAHQHKLDTIQSLGVAFASTVGSGVIVSVERGVYSFAGTGDVINAALTAALAVWLVLQFCTHLKSMSVILTPALVSMVAGTIGLLTLPYVSLIATSIGATINYFTTLQPLLMGALIAMAFTVIIVSPISTVGIAYSIGISGIAAAAANTGVAVAGVVLAVLSYKTNPFGTVLAHIIGTPKMQMVNFVKKPIMLFPCVAISGLLGTVAGALNFQMSTQAAGFGVIGGIGPIAFLNHLGWNALSVTTMFVYFFVVPFFLGLALQKLGKKSSLIADEDYTLEY